MLIKIKYTKRQLVWTIADNKPFEFPIESIRYTNDYYGEHVQYSPSATTNVRPEQAVWYDEEKCFVSKKRLLSSL